jgi:hypothetical protein
MDDDVLQQAIDRVRASGEAVTATRVRKALAAFGDEDASYQEVYQRLTAMGVLTDDAGADATSVHTGLVEHASAPEPQGPADHSSPADDHPQAEDPDPTDDPPPDPVADAEQALAQAQVQVTAMEVQLPALEHALAEAKTHLLAAFSHQRAVRDAVEHGSLPRHDALVGEAEAQVKATTRACQEAQWTLDQAEARVTRGQQQQTEATQQLALAQRDAYVQREAPDLWRRCQKALVAYAEDPLLREPMAHAASDVQRARWTHDHRLVGLEAELVALLEPATAQGLVPEDPRPAHQQKLVTRSRTWL